jgi:hypothetical protein
VANRSRIAGSRSATTGAVYLRRRLDALAQRSRHKAYPVSGEHQLDGLLTVHKLDKREA